MKLLWIRINIILAYPLLVAIDYAISKTTDESYAEVRSETNKRITKLWIGSNSR